MFECVVVGQQRATMECTKEIQRLLEAAKNKLSMVVKHAQEDLSEIKLSNF